VSYQVGPEDVVVVARDGKRVPPPGPRGFHAKLRSRRVMIAGILAALEFIAVAQWHRNIFVLVLFALLAVAAYVFAGRNLPPGPVRETAWIIAFAQGLLALVAVLIPVTIFFVLIFAFVVLIVLLMKLLGDRSRG
jgi:hypothetical protein